MPLIQSCLTGRSQELSLRFTNTLCWLFILSFLSGIPSVFVRINIDKRVSYLHYNLFYQNRHGKTRFCILYVFFQPNPQIFILFDARLRDCFGVDVKYYWDEGFLKFDNFVALLQYKADWSSNSYYLELQLLMVTRPRYFRQNVSDLTRIWTYDSTNVIPPNDTCATKMLRINVCTYIELEGVQDLLTHWNTFFDT